MDGWIKLHRKITESAIFSDPDLLRLWILCLSKAAYKERVVLVEKQEVLLLPGQFVTGRFSLHQDYNAGVPPRKKIKDTTLWSWLKRLETYGNLDIKSFNKYSVVSIVKWNDYQETLTTEPQQTDNKLTAEPQQTDTNKNLKNLEKEKNINNISASTSQNEFLVMDAFTQNFGPLVMPSTIRQYVNELRAQGQTDEMIIELMNEAGESATTGRPTLKFLKAIGQRWVENGITSREQSQALKQSQYRKTVPISNYRKQEKPDVIQPEPNGQAVTEEELEEMIRFAEQMQTSNNRREAR